MKDSKIVKFIIEFLKMFVGGTFVFMVFFALILGFIFFVSWNIPPKEVIIEMMLLFLRCAGGVMFVFGIIGGVVEATT